MEAEITITLTAELLALAVYLLVLIVLFAAGVAERKAFANPRYLEVALLSVAWPLWILQWPYYWVRGEYFADDVKRLRKRWEKFSSSHEK